MHCLNARYGVLDAPPFTRNWNADNFVDVYFRFRCVFQNNTAILNNIHDVKLSLTTLYSTWQHQLTYLNRQAKRCFFFQSTRYHNFHKRYYERKCFGEC